MITPNNLSITCPKCGSSNVVIVKRGYSFLLGILGIGVNFIWGSIAWILLTGYNHASDVAQSVMLTIGGGESVIIFITILGFLWGFLGSGELSCRCLDCGRKTRI